MSEEAKIQLMKEASERVGNAYYNNSQEVLRKEERQKAWQQALQCDKMQAKYSVSSPSKLFVRVMRCDMM